MNKKMISPELKPGDKVINLSMQDKSPIPPLTKGEVIRIADDPFEKDNKIIEVKWENGSRLAILSKYDKWMLVDDYQSINKKRIEESFSKQKNLMKGAELTKFYNLPILFKFLLQLRDSGIVNMFGSSDYLWMGKDRIDSLHRYDTNTEDNEEYEKLLDIADQAQSIMVKGAIKKLEDGGKTPDPSNINREIKRDASQILITWMSTY